MKLHKRVAIEGSKIGLKVTPQGSSGICLVGSQHELLSKEEEFLLAVACKKGDKTARDKLITSNLRLVISIAVKYRDRGCTFEDLVQEGNMGLMRAVQLFDPSRGFRLSTYVSKWVESKIGRLIDNSRMIRIPAEVLTLFKKIRRYETNYSAQYFRAPTAKEVSTQFKITIQKVFDTKALLISPKSLNVEIEGANDAIFNDLASDHLSEEIEIIEVNNRNALILQELLKFLNDEQIKVVKLICGLEGANQMSVSEVAQCLTKSEKHIGRVYKAAIRKLKNRRKNKYRP